MESAVDFDVSVGHLHSSMVKPGFSEATKMIYGLSTSKPRDLLASLRARRLYIVGMGTCVEGTQENKTSLNF